MPNVVILAGPNGAGKTSAAPVILRDRLRVAEFVNADVIARGLSGFAADTAAVEAGRIMLRRLDELAASGVSFAFEATLSGTTFLRSIDRWRATGYRIHIAYLWLAASDIAVDRVRHRIKQGGHAVPAEVVRRRYDRSVVNFATRYRSAADEWYVYDNTERSRTLIATGSPSGIEVLDEDSWRAFEKTVGDISRIREVFMADRPPRPDDDFARAWADVDGMNHAMDVSFARVIRRHRLLNQPLVFGENGKVVHVDPHTVPFPEGVTEEEMGPVFDYL